MPKVEIEWSWFAVLYGTATGKDRTRTAVVVPVGRREYQAIMLETRVDTDGSSLDEVAEGVLGQHSHKLIGTMRSLEEAVEAAERAMQGNDFGPRCNCDELP